MSKKKRQLPNLGRKKYELSEFVTLPKRTITRQRQATRSLSTRLQPQAHVERDPLVTPPLPHAVFFFSQAIMELN